MKRIKKLLIPLFTILTFSLAACSQALDNDKNTYHTIVWLNHDMSLLEKDTKVKDGETPTYHGETPTKDSTVKHTYTFIGWEPNVVPAYIDATYVAKYEEKPAEYTITWKNYNGVVLDTEQYAYGDSPVYKKEKPEKESDEQYDYIFTGWTPDIASVNANAEYTAVFTKKEKAVITINTPNGTIDVVSREDFDSLKDSNNCGLTFFNSMYNSLIWEMYMNQNSKLWTSELKPSTLPYSELVSISESFVSEAKNRARSNAISNGTSYEDEWNSILKEYGAKDAQELKEISMKRSIDDVLSNSYANLNSDRFIDSYLNIIQAYPFVTRHVFKRLEKNTNEDIPILITQNEANSICDTFSALLRNSFSITAYQFSDDGSTNQGGDTGIMDKNTSFVNEYKLGTYLYSLSKLEKENKNAEIHASNLQLSNSNKEKLGNLNLSYVPGRVFRLLGKYASTEKSNNGTIQKNGDPRYFPRNILFNKYINRHNFFLISNDEIAQDSSSTLSVYVDKDGSDFSQTSYYDFGEPQTGKGGFRNIPALCRDSEHKILTDENGQPIIGIISEYGLHFINIEKSGFDNNLTSYFSLTDESENSFIGRLGFENVESQKNYLIKRTMEFNKSLRYDLFKKLLSIDDSYSFNCLEKTYNLDKKISDAFIEEQENFLISVNANLSEKWNEYSALIEKQKQYRASSSLLTEKTIFDFLDGTLN